MEVSLVAEDATDEEPLPTLERPRAAVNETSSDVDDKESESVKLEPSEPVTSEVSPVSEPGDEADSLNVDPAPVKLVTKSVNDRLRCVEDWSNKVVVSTVVDEEAIEDEKLVVAVTFGKDLLTSRGKYILGFATGSALASVETAASAVTRSDVVCILDLFHRFIRASVEFVCWN